MADLSVILVNYNEREYLADVLSRLPAEFSGRELETIVVDNASHDGSAAMVREKFPQARLLTGSKDLMYGKGNNLGLAQATGKWLLIMNPDVRWEPGQLQAFFTAAQTAGDGLFAPRVISIDGSLQRTAHRRFPSLGTVFVDYCLPVQQFFLRLSWHPALYSESDHRHSRLIACATGMCLLVSRSVYNQVGGFDPDFSMYLEETDWQRRMATAGIPRHFMATAQLTHYGSAQKAFAQASPHYLWGLRTYARKHWNRGAQRLLPIVVWLATIISDVSLLAAWLPSWLLGRAGRRVRHYARQYARLTATLLTWPTRAPR